MANMRNNGIVRVIGEPYWMVHEDEDEKTEKKKKKKKVKKSETTGEGQLGEEGEEEEEENNGVGTIPEIVEPENDD